MTACPTLTTVIHTPVIFMGLGIRENTLPFETPAIMGFYFLPVTVTWTCHLHLLTRRYSSNEEREKVLYLDLPTCWIPGYQNRSHTFPYFILMPRPSSIHSTSTEDIFTSHVIKQKNNNSSHLQRHTWVLEALAQSQRLPYLLPRRSATVINLHYLCHTWKGQRAGGQ